MKIKTKLLAFLLLVPGMSFAASNQELNIESVDTGPKVAAVNDNLRRAFSDKLDLYPRGILPFTDLKYDLGEADRRWDTLYVSTITMGGGKITDLADGTNPTDAVNLGQLTSAGLSAATQANQETATSTSTYVSPARQQYHPSAAKAWVVFIGTGTVAITASYNVTSITDNGGSGDYSANFTTAFSSIHYACVCSPRQSSGGGNRICEIDNNALSTSLIRVRTIDTGGSAQDSDRIYIVCFGDQ